MSIRTVLFAASFLALSPVSYAQDDFASLPNAEQVAAAKADPDNWREVDPENLFIFETTKGRVLIEAFPTAAPRHVEQFRTIIRSGDYAGTRFHRVIQGFMAQGGDIQQLLGRDSGLPNIEAEFRFRRDPEQIKVDLLGGSDTSRQGYLNGAPLFTQSEFLAELTNDGMVDSWLAHCPGTVSTARTDDPNSANSQFFLMRGTAEWLDSTYTAWGRMVEGLSVAKALQTGEPPVTPDILQSTHVAADLPQADRPRVWVQRTDGPLFQEVLSGYEQDEPICDLPAVPTVVEDGVELRPPS